MSDTPTHCDECDPSFGCFATGTPCSKRPPDAQTPKVVRWTSGTVVQSDLGGFVAYGDYLTLERENADLRRQLVGVEQVVSYQCDLVVDLHAKMEKLEEQLADARVAIEHLSPSCAALLGRAETAEADAREAREDASRAAMDAVRYANELAAERAIPRACRALEGDEVGAPCAYLRDAEQQRDDAIAWIRMIGEECVLAGYKGGDRDVILANVRDMRFKVKAIDAARKGEEGKL